MYSIDTVNLFIYLYFNEVYCLLLLLFTFVHNDKLSSYVLFTMSMTSSRCFMFDLTQTRKLRLATFLN